MHSTLSLRLAILFGLISLRPVAGAVAPWPTEGWPQSTPEEQGMDSSLLQSGASYILSQCPSRYSFVVVRNGYVVWEQYFHGVPTDRYANAAAATAEVRNAAPALFLWKNKFAVAQDADYTPVGGAALLPEIQATPASPGETIVLYGTGFGSTGMAGSIGELARQAMPLATLPSVSIGGTAAKVEYAGIPEGGAGLYQINVSVPESAADGDLQVTVDYGEAEAPPSLLSVKRRPNGPSPNRR